jgi:glycosyltransferase involved in cell wall biosynthesis
MGVGLENSDLQLSIVIPTHRRADSLLRLLKSMRSQQLGPDQYEVIVVSNLPDQETELQLSQLMPKFNLSFFTAGKVGVNWARNLGLEKASADLIMFLDDDCELTHSDHLQRIITIHQQLPHVAAVGGLYSLHKDANAYEVAYTRMSNQWVKDSLDNELMQVERLLGGNVCYKKSLLDKHNLRFNPEIVFGGAETELHNRMVALHMDMRLSNLSVRHHVKLDAQTFFAKAIRQGFGTQFHSPQNPQLSLKLLSKKSLPLLEFQYRHLFRIGQQKAQRNETWPSAKISRQKMWLYELESRLTKGASDAFAVMSLIYWTAYHHTLVFLGEAWRRIGLAWRVVVVSFHKIYWPVHGTSSKALIRTRYLVWHFFRYRVGAGGWHILRHVIGNRIWRLGQSFFWAFVHAKHFVYDQVRHQIPAFFLHRLPNTIRGEMKRLNVRIRAGFDDRLAGYKFSVSEKPSIYMPISNSCTQSCDYCHLLKAKGQMAESEHNGSLASEFRHMGYRRLTLPCNSLELSKEDLNNKLAELSDFEKEVLLNPDLLEKTNWRERLETLKDQSYEFLLLHRPGQTFRKIYKYLKSTDAAFRILSVQDVSPELPALYSNLYPEDQQLVEWLSTSAVEPILRDPKNRKRAQKIASTLKFLEKEKIRNLPKTSNLHYPFLVPSENAKSVLPRGQVEWSSKSWDQDTTAKYSIVVPVRFQNSHACKILRNFSANEYDKKAFEVIFIDDGNDVPLAPILESVYTDHGDPALRVRVVRWDRQLGDHYDDSYRAGQARNLGVRHSRGDRLLFIDSDIIMSPRLLFELDEKLTDNVLVQFPRHMLKESASKAFRPYEDINHDEDTYRQDHYWEQFKATEDWHSLKNYWKYTCTYGLGVTRKTFESIGPFRSEYIYYGFEDVDFGYRLYQKGAKFLLLKSPVYHLYPDAENSFHFDQQKRFNALSRSASIFLHRNFDLAFYMDLNHYLDSSVSLRLLKPYYYLRYKWKALVHVAKPILSENQVAKVTSTKSS